MFQLKVSFLVIKSEVYSIIIYFSLKVLCSLRAEVLSSLYSISAEVFYAHFKLKYFPLFNLFQQKMSMLTSK